MEDYDYADDVAYDCHLDHLTDLDIEMREREAELEEAKDWEDQNEEYEDMRRASCGYHN